MERLSEIIGGQTAITTTNGAAGTSAINGTVYDMAGYDGLIVQVAFGTITAGAVTSIKLQDGAASDLSDAADVAGSGITVADTDDDKVFLYDVTVPMKRYVRVVVSRATQNAVVGSAMYLGYRPGKKPTTNNATWSVLKLHAPAEGTP